MWPFNKKKTTAGYAKITEKHQNMTPPIVEITQELVAPKLDIGCVAQEILKDLSLENHPKWHIEVEQLAWSYCYTAQMEGKKYKVCFSRLCSHFYDSGYNVWICGMTETTFNRDERKALSDAFEAMQDAKKELKKQNTLKEEREVLAQLFPNCFLTKDNDSFSMSI